VSSPPNARIRRVFKEFEPGKVSSFGHAQIDRPMEDEAVIRSRPQLEAVVHNAQTLVELGAEHGRFGRYLEAHADTSAVAKHQHRQFLFNGRSGAYVFPYTVDEPVPPHSQ
jgi:3-methyladenine DNA glycosylase Tag